MLIAADSPVINNPPFSNSPTNLYDLKSLPMALQSAGLTWGNYGGFGFLYNCGHAKNSLKHTPAFFPTHTLATQPPPRPRIPLGLPATPHIHPPTPTPTP